MLYEAPHRVLATLADLAAACGDDRPVALARELTKLHEEVWRGTLHGAIGHVTDDPARGEYVVVVAGAPAAAAATDDRRRGAPFAAASHAGLDRKSAVAEVAAALGVPKRQVYDAALRVLATP